MMRMSDFVMGLVCGLMLIFMLSAFTGGIPNIFELPFEDEKPTNSTTDVHALIDENHYLKQEVIKKSRTINETQRRVSELENTSYYTQYQEATTKLNAEIKNNPDYLFLSLATVLIFGLLAFVMVYFVTKRHQTKKMIELENENRDLKKDVGRLKGEKKYGIIR